MTEEKLKQVADLANSIGPVCNPVKELYAFISRGKDGYEGVMSFTPRDDAPFTLECVTSEKDTAKQIARKLKEEMGAKHPDITVRLCRFVLAEEIQQL